jgi:hypothetical protein
LRGLAGGAEGIRTDGHRGRGEISSYVWQRHNYMLYYPQNVIILRA